MAELVSTTYTLYLKSCAAVTKDLNLNELLKTAMKHRSVGLVGLSERGTDGGWSYECQQLSLENSHLTFSDGYLYSTGPCLFCDVTSESFLVATDVVRAVLPDSSLPNEIRSFDWALRLRTAGVLTMTCPESMHHVTRNIIPKPEEPKKDTKCTTKQERLKFKDESLTVKRLYRKLAQKWQLTTIQLHNKTSLEYNCLEIHFDCKAKERVREYLLPPCCLRIKNRMLKAFHTIAQETLIPYEILSGSLLGAVKFKDGIPWDFDDDCRYPNQFANLLETNKQRLQEMGLPSLTFAGIPSSDGKPHKYYTANGQGGFSFDIWGVETLPTEGDRRKLEQMPLNIPCLLYGHYPIPIQSYIKGNENVTKAILLQRQEMIRDAPAYKKLILNNRPTKIKNKPKTFPPLPRKSCFLQSFVRVGDNWVLAGWNPAVQAKKHVGSHFFKHRAHWRFEKANDSWPSCSYPGHPMCLNLHPMDGSIPFS